MVKEIGFKSRLSLWMGLSDLASLPGQIFLFCSALFRVAIQAFLPLCPKELSLSHSFPPPCCSGVSKKQGWARWAEPLWNTGRDGGTSALPAGQLCAWWMLTFLTTVQWQQAFLSSDQFCPLASCWTSVNMLLRGLIVCSFAIKAKM